MVADTNVYFVQPEKFGLASFLMLSFVSIKVALKETLKKFEHKIQF